MNLSLARFVCSAGGAVIALSLAGCGREEIRVYTAPKEIKSLPDGHFEGDGHDHSSHAGHDHGSAAAPKLGFTTPPGWEQAPPGELNLALFKAKSDAGEATVAVTPLAQMAGQEAFIVNMWRQQVGQGPLSDQELPGALTPVDVGGDKGQLFEIAGQRDGQSLRIITAFVHRPEASWFYKLQGSDAAVNAQKQAFLDFLKSIKIENAPGRNPSTVGPAAAQAPSPTADREFKWQIPDGWTKQTPGQMQVGKFTVPEQNGAKAEVSVSVFPSDTGGNLENVKRWRRQLGMPDADDATVQQAITPLEGGPSSSVLVDLTHDSKQLVGAIVPRDGQWFFYKLMGDAPAVAAARESFVSFAKAQP